MSIIEGLIANAVSKIVVMSGTKAWKAASRNEKVLKILKAVGLKPGVPEADFKSVYVHTLIEYGIEKLEPVLIFFRHEDIRKAFQKSFEKDDFSILSHEAEHLLDWNRIGDELRDNKLDPRLEFARFTLVFNEMVDRTRSPAEARRDAKIDKLLRLAQEGDIEKIRAKNLEMIQGSTSKQLKEWFKTLGYASGGHDVQTPAGPAGGTAGARCQSHDNSRHALDQLLHQGDHPASERYGEE